MITGKLVDCIQDEKRQLIDGLLTDQYVQDFQFQMIPEVKSYTMFEQPNKCNKIVEKFLNSA